MASSHPRLPETAPNVLIAGPLPPNLLARLDAGYATCKLWQESDPSAFLAQHGSRFDVLATSGVFGADSALMAQLPNLRLIASFGVGTDPIDLAEAAARGVQVTNTPGVLNACVADAALGLLLGLTRRIVSADRSVRAGAWNAARQQLGTSLKGKICGIVGLGAIGREIAHRAGAFGMVIAYHVRREVDTSYRYYASLVDMARDSDVLILSLPGGASTHHLVDATVLQALGPSGVLVNVARGSVVDENALVEALTNRTLGGAALDVFKNEPHVPPALMSLDNVVLTPHIGSATTETREAMSQLLLENIAAYAASRQVPSPV